MNEVLVFDISSFLAHFKNPATIASPCTYSFPPATSVVGIVGAICGYKKESKDFHNECLQKINSADFIVAVQLLNPVRVFTSGYTWMNTKDLSSTESVIFRHQKCASPTVIQKLIYPHYRIYFAHENQEVFNELRGHLEQGTSVYTPCLGKACCVANINYVGCKELRPIKIGSKVKINTAIDKNLVKIDYDKRHHYDIGSMASRMNIDRSVKTYITYCVEVNTHPINTTVAEEGVYECEDNIICTI